MSIRELYFMFTTWHMRLPYWLIAVIIIVFIVLLYRLFKLSVEKNDYRKYFKETYSIFIDNLQNKQHNISMEFLSMGMTDSYDIAIEEGSDIVRIGSAIFGSRYN